MTDTDHDIESPPEGWPDEHMLEAAWGIIANAWWGDWSKASPEWQQAATRWRDAYHRHLDIDLERDKAR